MHMNLKCLVEPRDEEFERIELTASQDCNRLHALYSEICVKEEMLSFDEFVDIDNNVQVSEMLSEKTEPPSAQACNTEEFEEEEENEIPIVKKSQMYNMVSLYSIFAAQTYENNKDFSSQLTQLARRLETMLDSHKPNLVQRIEFYLNCILLDLNDFKFNVYSLIKFSCK